MNNPTFYIHPHITTYTHSFMQVAHPTPMHIDATCINTTNGHVVTNTVTEITHDMVIDQSVTDRPVHSAQLQEDTAPYQPVASQPPMPASLPIDNGILSVMEQSKPDIRMNLAEYQALLQLSSQNKENQSIQTKQRQTTQYTPSYFIGDADSQSSGQDDNTPQSDSDQDDILGGIEQQQDQNLQFEQYQELDSDDQQESEDEYPDDYDSDQDQDDTNFDSLFQTADSHNSKHQNQQEFLERYKKVKLALQTEEIALRQQQMIFGVTMPLEMQMRKMKVSQCLLNLINNNYVKRLRIGSNKGKNRKQVETEQYLKAGQGEFTSPSEQESQNNDKKISLPKTPKKVSFRENILAKVYKNDEEVNIINEAEQLNEALNTCEKDMRRLITLTPIRSPQPPKQTIPNKPQPSCEQILAKFQCQLSQKKDKKPDHSQNTAIKEIIAQLKGVTEINYDLDNTDTNNSGQVNYQQIQNINMHQNHQPPLIENQNTTILGDQKTIVSHERQLGPDNILRTQLQSGYFPQPVQTLSLVQ